MASSSSAHFDDDNDSDGLTEARPTTKRPRDEPLDYRNKVILAPMVRVSQLPFRLYCLDAGADLVFGPEIVDHSFVQCERYEVTRHQHATGFGIDTIEYRRPGDRHRDNLVFQTCERERGVNIFQLGTNDAVRALQAATLVAKDVAGIDVNMGCPKHFSVQGGMGAALLRSPERAHDIISTLSRNLSVPVTCKIRLLDTIENTIAFARVCEQAGARAVTVHMRHIDERPRQPAHWDWLRPVVDALSIPVIANGDVWRHEHIDEVKAATGVSSVMVARGALENPNIFQSPSMPSYPTPIDTLRRISAYAIDTGNHLGATKALITRLFCEAKSVKRLSDTLPPHQWPDGYQQLGAVGFKSFHELADRLFDPELARRIDAIGAGNTQESNTE